MKRLDLVGQRFSRLLVSGNAEPDRFGHTNFHVICDCGTKKVVGGSQLVSGVTQSCGCLGRERRAAARVAGAAHGYARRGKKTAEYTTWVRMITRCENEKVRCYPHYGGRGIKVCDRWRGSFEAFLADMARARVSSTRSTASTTTATTSPAIAAGLIDLRRRKTVDFRAGGSNGKFSGPHAA